MTGAGWAGRGAGWLRASRGGLFVLALPTGVAAGLGAVAFRYLIYFFTWLATGHSQFGLGTTCWSRSSRWWPR